VDPKRIAGEWIPLRVLPNGAPFVTRDGTLAIKVNSITAGNAPGVKHEISEWDAVKQVAIADLLAYVAELEEESDRRFRNVELMRGTLMIIYDAARDGLPEDEDKVSASWLRKMFEKDVLPCFVQHASESQIA
jgi:hypothetical protein